MARLGCLGQQKVLDGEHGQGLGHGARSTRPNTGLVNFEPSSPSSFARSLLETVA